MVRSRYAPSPTGYMTIGNLRSALYEYLIAKREGGVFILRLEDTDQQRYVEGAAEIIYETLNRTGLKVDEGPGVGGGLRPLYPKRAQGFVFAARAKAGGIGQGVLLLLRKGQA